MNKGIDTSTIGGRIKKLRIEAGFTQEELAEKLHLEGKSAISNYENNTRNVSAQMLSQLSTIFYTSSDYILHGDNTDNIDAVINEATTILNNLKSDEAKNAAVVVLKQIQILEK